MWDLIIVVLILIIAAAVLVWRLYKQWREKGCHCACQDCAKKDCP